MLAFRLFAFAAANGPLIECAVGEHQITCGRGCAVYEITLLPGGARLSGGGLPARALSSLKLDAATGRVKQGVAKQQPRDCMTSRKESRESAREDSGIRGLFSQTHVSPRRDTFLPEGNGESPKFRYRAKSTARWGRSSVSAVVPWDRRCWCIELNGSVDWASSAERTSRDCLLQVAMAGHANGIGVRFGTGPILISWHDNLRD